VVRRAWSEKSEQKRAVRKEQLKRAVRKERLEESG
jgi:hypothetical protein